MNAYGRNNTLDELLGMLGEINRLCRDLGYSPSFRELMAATAIRSYSSAVSLARELRGMGWIDFRDNTARTFRLTQAGRDALARLTPRETQ